MQQLAEQEIHLWFIRDETIVEESVLEEYYKLLNENERARHERFQFNRDKKQFAITRAAIRTILSKYVEDVRPQSWEFRNNEYGKPSIVTADGKCPVRFNISHSKELIVIAVSLNCELGVDVEYVHRTSRTGDLAERFFSTIESTALGLLPVELRRERFFDLWTLKEAYIKACGLGLAIPLDQFSFSFPGPEKIAISFDERRNDSSQSWSFWQFVPAISHKVAVAIKKPEPTLNFSFKMWNLIPSISQQSIDIPILRASLTQVPRL